MTEVIMPRLSDTMEEGTITRWLKLDGAVVTSGEPLVEIETDKATVIVEATGGGVLEIVADEGVTVSVGASIARVAQMPDHSESPAGAPSAGASPPAGAAPAAAAASTAATSAMASASQPPETPAAAEVAGSVRVNASPVARRLAAETGIDLATLTGSGPGGRIVKTDVEIAAAAAPPRPTDSATTAAPARPADTATAAAPARPADTATAAAPPPADPATAAARASSTGALTLPELSRTQQLIARRMSESHATIPTFTVQADVDMEACAWLRSELGGLDPSETPSYNDMVLKACALTLREFPKVNASYGGDHVELHSQINVGVAVEAEDGLLVTTVFDADTKPLRALARETGELIKRARAGTATPAELSGATFTVSNLGMSGVRNFTAIVNPPQVAILAVGAVEPRAVVRDSEIVARKTMGVTLACDHRLIYGAEAAAFIARLRYLLEHPLTLDP
jgi:pyruvate dehydrogenase E2 component (dihydrolipoamide acetyltransferase)